MSFLLGSGDTDCPRCIDSITQLRAFIYSRSRTSANTELQRLTGHYSVVMRTLYVTTLYTRSLANIYAHVHRTDFAGD